MKQFIPPPIEAGEFLLDKVKKNGEVLVTNLISYTYYKDSIEMDFSINIKNSFRNRKESKDSALYQNNADFLIRQQKLL